MNRQERKKRDVTILLAAAILSIVFVAYTPNTAFGHASFTFVPGNGTGADAASCRASTNCFNSTMHQVRLVIGETFEPAFTDQYHDLEFSMTHILTRFGLGNAHKDQTAAATKASDFSASGKVLFVDTYFYPASKLVNSAGQLSTTGTVGVKPGTSAGNANTYGFYCGNGGSISSGVITGNAYNCVANEGGTFGYEDSRTGMFLRPLSASEGASNPGGQYRQNVRQLYTEQGLTLYHIYGSINYFNDTSIGLTKVSIWTDGKNVKTVSMAASDGSGNRTYSLSGGFGLRNITSVYWPDADGGVTESTHPGNLRKAIGEIRQDNWDIFNFLRDIAGGINQIITHTAGAGANMTVPAAKP